MHVFPVFLVGLSCGIALSIVVLTTLDFLGFTFRKVRTTVVVKKPQQ